MQINNTNQTLFFAVTTEEQTRYEALQPEIEVAKQALHKQIQDLQQTVRLQKSHIKRLYTNLKEINNRWVGFRIFIAIAINCATVAAACFAIRAFYQASFHSQASIFEKTVLTASMSSITIFPATLGLCIIPYFTPLIPDRMDEIPARNALNKKLFDFQHNIGVLEQRKYQYGYLSDRSKAVKFLEANTKKAQIKKLGATPAQIKERLQAACADLQAQINAKQTQINAYQADIQQLDKPLTTEEIVTWA